MKQLTVLLIPVILLFANYKVSYAFPTQKVEQQINIMNQQYSSTSSTPGPNDNSLGLIHWDGSLFNGETVYLEAVMLCNSCTGGNQAAKIDLYTQAGAAVSGATGSTQSSTFSRISVDVTALLTNNTVYTVRFSRDATAGTAFLNSARLVIVQNASAITDTVTQIELGANENTTNTSYTLLTNPKIFYYDTDVRTQVTNVFFEATIKSSNPSTTAYAALSSSPTCATTVTNSPVTVTASSWDRVRSADIEANLVDNTAYWVCIQATNPRTTSISNAKIIIEQSDTDGIDKLETIHQYIGYVSTDTDSTYTTQNFLNLYNPANFTADYRYIYHEAVLNTSAGTAYAHLYNVSDTASLDNSAEVSTTQTSYTRVRSADLNSIMPSSSKTLDAQLKNSATNTTSAASSTLIIQLQETPIADLSFTVEGVSAGVTTNGITTSEASDYYTLPFGNLAFGSPKYVAHRLSATTNASRGYTVTMKLSNFLQGNYPANNIDPFISTWNTPTTWTEPVGLTANTNTGWFGANTSDTRVSGWSAAASKFGPVNNSANTVMSATGPDTGTSAYVTYAVEVNIFQPADLYSGSIIYDILPTY